MSGYPKGGTGHIMEPGALVRRPGETDAEFRARLRGEPPVSICQKCFGLARNKLATPCPRPVREQGQVGRQFLPPTCGGQMLPLEEDELATFRLGGDKAVADLVRAKLKARR